jgi:hypothetical protein
MKRTFIVAGIDDDIVRRNNSVAILGRFSDDVEILATNIVLRIGMYYKVIVSNSLDEAYQVDI